jgi:hypothetical protein
MILAPWSCLMYVPTDCYCPRGFSPAQVQDSTNISPPSGGPFQSIEMHIRQIGRRGLARFMLCAVFLPCAAPQTDRAAQARQGCAGLWLQPLNARIILSARFLAMFGSLIRAETPRRHRPLHRQDHPLLPSGGSGLAKRGPRRHAAKLSSVPESETLVARPCRLEHRPSPSA